MILALLPVILSAQTNTFPASGDVGIGTTSPQYPLDVSGNIHTSGTLIAGSQTLGQSVTFAPTTAGWYRVLSGASSLGGRVQIYSEVSGNPTDIELQFNIAGYGTAPYLANIQQTPSACLCTILRFGIRTSALKYNLRPDSPQRLDG